MATSLGLAFVGVGFAAMFLMYYLWGFPYDKATRISSAPRWAMRVHRGLGYLFAMIYVVMMWHMVPRLWSYQVEFPARTTVHIIVGFTIGFLLLVKIAIIRFFRHFEEWMPFLGTAIVLGTVILIGLSLPNMLQERSLANAAPGGDAFSAPSRARVARLLPSAGLPNEVSLASLSTVEALRDGREVLLDNCVKCHDLRTILLKPRSASAWWNTVERMAEKPALFQPMTEREMYEVAAYLIAITPDLQRASKQRHHQQIARADAVAETTLRGADSAESSSSTTTAADSMTAAPDLGKAKATFEEVCSQCHELSDIDKAPPKSPSAARAMIQRMIKDNEAELTAEQIKLVAAWLDEKYRLAPRKPH